MPQRATMDSRKEILDYRLATAESAAQWERLTLPAFPIRFKNSEPTTGSSRLPLTNRSMESLVSSQTAPSWP